MPIGLKLLHLARDEKFVPLMQQLFEQALPGRNQWLIARKFRARRFVQRSDTVTCRPEWWLRTPLVRRDMRQGTVIVAHSMPTIFAKAIRRASPEARVVWLGWGYDYYPLLEPLLGDPVLPGTRALAGDRDVEASPGTAPAARPRRKTMALSWIADRIHTCCIIPTEVPLLRQVLPDLTAQAHDLPLFTAEDTFDRGGEMHGHDWLLGNSATASNNHAEAFELLQGRLGAGRLVVPLSYGDSGYGERVAARGKALFGDSCDPLREWMSLDDYNRRTAGCGFVVMNHRRQQAVGNIGAALYRGATVYLRQDNPLFPFYRGLGLVLRDVDDLARTAVPVVPITDEERRQNRTIIGAYYARSRVIDAIRNLPAVTA